MTNTRYFLARIAQAFGINRRSRRMAELATESHLLREAEQVLGERIWQGVEEVEELGVEYWNLRRLTSERERLQEQAQIQELRLAEAHHQRAELLLAKSSPQEDLEQERSKLLEELDALARRRDQIVGKARDIRRIYDGFKAKIEVLREERREDGDTVTKTQARMGELRESFELLKTERNTVVAQIEERDAMLAALDEKIDDVRSKQRAEASVAFQAIGDANRQLSQIRAEIGLLETRMLQLYAEIGRHVSRNFFISTPCRDAAKAQRPMVEVMTALRRSISLNQRLADTSD